MRAWISAARATLLGVLALVGCSQDPNVTAGCASGNRAQCLVETSVGAHFACSVLTDHSVWCWGRNDESQLGYPTTDLCNEDIGGGQTRAVACHTFPSRVQSLDRVTSVASGDAFSCALRDDGSVQCWGANDAGQLGNGRTLPSEQPVVVTALAHVTSLALGARHACAIVNGGVQCWGANDKGQLGVPTPSQCTIDGHVGACSLSPVAVSGLTGVVEIVAGAAHTCARTSDGHVQCWGDNSDAQLGIGMTGAMPMGMRLPVRVGAQTLAAVRAMAAGANHTCVLRDVDGVYCWGRADHGELGLPLVSMTPIGCTHACSPVAVAVSGLPSAPSPMGGMDGGTTTSDASVDAMSRPGDAMASTSMGPQAIAAGDGFTCAVLADTTLRCWGRNDVGQLGNGATSNNPEAPAMVIATPGAASNNPLQNVTDLASGTDSSCAKLADGSLRCWGSNQDGALGTGNPNQPLGPVPVGW
jgi:alpha-tubulin suppressor-like RCC1 family protein